VDAYNHGDFALAFRLLSQGAASGNSDAQVNLGYMFARGHGVKADQAQALRLYELSAQQNNGEGTNALGYKFQFGTGVKADIDRAVHYYCLAVMQGNPRAMNNLAILVNRGQGVPQDAEEARRLWRQAAEGGDVNSMFNLGASLLADPEQTVRQGAASWIQRAAMAGQVLGQRMLRQWGYTGTLPPARDNALLMKIQPADMPSGRTKICVDLVS
jgi:uncharacterized protein